MDLLPASPYFHLTIFPVIYTVDVKIPQEVVKCLVFRPPRRQPVTHPMSRLARGVVELFERPPPSLVGHMTQNPMFEPWSSQAYDLKIDACHYLAWRLALKGQW